MNYAIILAAGKGQRCKGVKDKLFVEVAGKPLLYYSIIAFNDHPEIDEITIVVNKKNKEKTKKLIKEFELKKIKKIVLGAKSRQGSVEQGINSLEKKAKPKDVIMVHNAANPLPSTNEISECIKQNKETQTG